MQVPRGGSTRADEEGMHMSIAPGPESWWQSFMLNHTVGAIGVACAVNAVLVSFVVTAIAVR